MSFHLRYTPHELPNNDSDLRNIADHFTEKFDRYIIAEERKDKKGNEVPIHYHCYIESNLNIDTVRWNVQRWLGIPTGGAGRNNKYYMLKKWDNNIAYIVKQGKIISYKGYSSIEEILRARVPPDPVEKIEIKNTSVAGPAPPKEKKEIGMWNQIMEEAQFMQLRKKIEIDLEEALKIISRIYIKKLLPLPHPGDRKRWATSLVMYSKMGFDVESDPTLREKLIEEEALQFIGENMVKPVTNG